MNKDISERRKHVHNKTRRNILCSLLFFISFKSISFVLMSVFLRKVESFYSLFVLLIFHYVFSKNPDLSFYPDPFSLLLEILFCKLYTIYMLNS